MVTRFSPIAGRTGPALRREGGTICIDTGVWQDSIAIKRVARIFHALQDPTRLRIFLALSAPEAEYTVIELAELVGKSQAKVREGVAVLEGTGIVGYRQQRRSKRKIYFLTRQAEVSLCFDLLGAFAQPPATRALPPSV